MLEAMNPERLDILKELCNVGAGHAGTVLSQLIGKRVDLDVPQIVITDLKKVPRNAGGVETVIVGLYFGILGDAKGTILMIFSEESARRLVRLVCGIPEDLDLDDPMSISAMREIGNILSSAFLSAISQLSGLTLLPSVPGYVRDRAGAVLDLALAAPSPQADAALVIETVLRETGEETHGTLFLLPDPHTLEQILGAVEKHGSR